MTLKLLISDISSPSILLNLIQLQHERHIFHSFVNYVPLLKEREHTSTSRVADPGDVDPDPVHRVTSLLKSEDPPVGLI